MARLGILVALCTLLALTALQVPLVQAEDPAPPLVTSPSDLGTPPRRPRGFTVPVPVSQTPLSASSGITTSFVIPSIFGSPTQGGGYTTATGTQFGRLNRNAIPSNCESAKSYPGIPNGGAFDYKYDAYTFTNTSDFNVCAQIYVSAAGYSTADILFPAVYLNSFNPTDISQNYLGDAGGGTDAFAFSALVPAHTPFVVVLSEVNQGIVSVYILGVNLQRLVYLPLVIR